MTKTISIVAGLTIALVFGAILFYGHNKPMSNDDTIDSLSAGKMGTKLSRLSDKTKKTKTTGTKRNTVSGALKELDGRKPRVVKPSGIRKAVQAQDEIMGYRLNNRNKVMRIQTALQKAGFYTGPIDGKNNKVTKRAVKKFQESKGLVADGVVGPRTRKALEEYLKTGG